ncbi:hypothetical protein FC093_11235 [Ilyomonas limi]|uniref:DUF4134 domain-containing protein n=1 Tax=Ilyomonas limi TaxID=2575867 RepID=A0A4U3L0E6_9BACT|nr:hypothetical protein [Ilyomonas limi]TKK68202.1 hypothetical protein FC093_11235 [Ilyomonas limi]
MPKRNNYKKSNMIRAVGVVAFACLLSVTAVYAQGPEAVGDGLDGETTTNVPFDGGVSLLVAAGIGYGAKKAYNAKKKGTTEENNEAAPCL